MANQHAYIVRITREGKTTWVASHLALLGAGKDIKTFTDDRTLAERYPTKEMARKAVSWAHKIGILENPSVGFTAEVVMVYPAEQTEKAVPVDPTHILLKQYSIDDDPECESKIAQKVKEFIWEIEHNEKYLPFKTVLDNNNAPGALSYVTDRVLDKVRRYYGRAVGNVLAWQHESLAKRFLYKNTRNELRKYAKSFTFSQKYVDNCTSDRSWSEIDKEWARSLMKCDKDLPNSILALNGYYRLGLMTQGSTPKTGLTPELYILAHPKVENDRLTFIERNLPILYTAILLVAEQVAIMVWRGPDFDMMRSITRYQAYGIKKLKWLIGTALADELTTLRPENLGRIAQNSDEWESVALRWPYRPSEDTLALRMMYWLVRKKIVRHAVAEVVAEVRKEFIY